MSVRLTWFPAPEPSVVSFKIQRSDAVDGTYTLIATIPADTNGPNYDSGTGQYFYVDGAGTVDAWYRLLAHDVEGSDSLPSAPFQPQTDVPSIPATTRVDHNYPTPGNLRYQTLASVPIAQAVIRVFYESDFLSGNTEQPLAITQTDAGGNWLSPVYLVAGYNYVVQFAKAGWYGPDIVTITV